MSSPHLCDLHSGIWKFKLDSSITDTSLNLSNRFSAILCPSVLCKCLTTEWDTFSTLISFTSFLCVCSSSFFYGMECRCFQSESVILICPASLWSASRSIYYHSSYIVCCHNYYLLGESKPSLTFYVTSRSLCLPHSKPYQNVRGIALDDVPNGFSNIEDSFSFIPQRNLTEGLSLLFSMTMYLWSIWNRNFCVMYYY